MEDYDEDILYIANKRNLTSKLGELARVKNPTPGKLTSSRQRMRKYMSVLHRDVKRKLFELYKVDFKMFGYKYELH